MFAETNYYQISGYRAHSNGWFKKFDDKPMTQAIINTKSKLFRPGGKDAPLELVLGILPCGTSYLLMTNEQMLEFTHEHRLTTPRESWRAANFLSLSPIYFDSLNELAAKIAMYKQLPRNKNRRESEVPQDNSKANRGYGEARSKDIDRYRGVFEHQRILYRLLTKDLEPGKVGLASPSWLGCVRVLSLVLVEWSVDNRPRADRQREPLLVEVGWTEATFPAFFEQLTGATVHFRLKANKKNPASKDPYFSEVVEGDQEELYSRLRNLFRHDANKSGIPLIVLVHNEDMARGVLARAGIDIDTWSSGLSKLLPRASAPVRRPYKVEGDTPSLAVLPEPCFVDTRKLVNTLMRDNAGDRDAVPHTAKRLHMQTDTRTCAGDDSLLQLRMWTSMAQGPAIDEQCQRRSTLTPVAQVLAPPAQQQVNADGDADDVDPNDFAPSVAPAIPFDFSDDDDDW